MRKYGKKRVTVTGGAGFLGSHLCRRLLGEPAHVIKLADAPLDYRERYEQLTGKSLRACPKCGHGRMVCIDTFLPGALPRAPPHDHS